MLRTIGIVIFVGFSVNLLCQKVDSLIFLEDIPFSTLEEHSSVIYGEGYIMRDTISTSIFINGHPISHRDHNFFVLPLINSCPDSIRVDSFSISETERLLRDKDPKVSIYVSSDFKQISFPDNFKVKVNCIE